MFQVSTVVPMLVSAALGAGPGVRPADGTVLGESRERLQRAYDRLCSPPLSDLDFVLSDVSFKLTRRFTEYSGDVSGRMLGALVSGGPALGQDSAIVGQLVGGLAGFRKPDGHFGVEQNLEAGIQPGRDMPILWGNSRLLLAFVQRYARTKDLACLDLARGIGDYVVATRNYFGKPENLALGGSYSAGYTTCYPALIEGMALLAEATGGTQYLDEARHIAGIALQDTSFDKHHSHGRLSAYRGMLEIDRVAGTREFLPAVQAGWEKIAVDLVLPTGGVTEVFDRTDTRDEGCSEVDWVVLNVMLWRTTGQSRYLDMADHALRNHLLATQFPNGGFGHHQLRTLKAGDRTYLAGGFENVGAESYWCCSMHGAQCLGDLARWGVVSDRGAVAVTWLAEVRTVIARPTGTVTVSAIRSAPDAWRLDFQANAVAEFPLRLRVPHAADVLVIDGNEVVARDGWVELPCRVDRARTVEVKLPGIVRMVGPYADRPADTGPVRVFAAGDLYCLPDAYLPEGFLAAGAVPTVTLSAESSGGPDIPVVVYAHGGSQAVETRLVPVSRRPAGGCRFLFEVRRTEQRPAGGIQAYTPSGVPVEVTLACEARCEITLNGKPLGSREGWGESARMEVYARKGTNVLAVKASATAARPGVIAMIRTPDGLHVTSHKTWSVMKITEPVAPDLLTRADRSAGGEPLLDLGGFGAEPWRHLPAEFAGTDARWIWPGNNEADATYLLRYVFEIGR